LNAHSLLADKSGFTLKTAKFTSHYAPDEPEGSRAAFEALNGPVLWSDAVQKINKGGKVDERVLVLTKTSIFLTKAWKASPKRTLVINGATLSISQQPDTVVVIKGAPTGDWLINLTPDTLAELASRFTAKGSTGKLEITPSYGARFCGRRCTRGFNYIRSHACCWLEHNMRLHLYCRPHSSCVVLSP
jgi:hypothetical protein